MKRHVVIAAISAVMMFAASVDQEELAFIGKRGRYWAFQKPARPIAPNLRSSWGRTPVDAFILEKLQEKKLTPSEELPRLQLIRRVTFDLTGLPPTPEEVTAFLNDKSPQAYENLVDRLLASPHYGERWASKWLDVVRYADTNGFELDADRPHAWRYRDYVIDAFNSDKPFTTFIQEQIAGDEMFPGSKEALIATGYLRAGSEHLVAGNIDPAESRQEVLTEIATNIGQTFLGLTVNCARCHNHKFDPITQADFYRLQAIFAGAKADDIEIAAPDEKAAWEKAYAAYKERLQPIEQKLKELAKPFEEAIRAERKAKLEPAALEALNTPEDKRTPEQKVLAKNAQTQIKPAWDEVVDTMPPDVQAVRARLRARLNQVKQTAPDPLAKAYSFVNTKEAPPTSFVLRMGDPHAPLNPVAPGVPVVLKNGLEFSDASPGRRTALANWLASPDNPLTARVMVNRIWQFRMGQGLVRTPNDFGLMGDKPADRTLLDWLATEFVEQGWSVKKLDRLIVTSSVYRQASANSPEKAEIDPDNRLFWRMNRKRLEGEAIRDFALAAAGTLNAEMGGRPVRIPIEPEVYDLIFTEFERDGLWPVPPNRHDQNRRGIYLYNKRSVRLPLLAAFDQPDAVTSCPVRPVSTHALQALSLFNSDFMHDVAADFANLLERSCGGDRKCSIETAWQRALSRTPRPEERALAAKFLGSGGNLHDMCLALLNRNEFLYVP